MKHSKMREIIAADPFSVHQCDLICQMALQMQGDLA